MLRPAAVTAMTLLLASVAVAQVAPAPPRDRARAPLTGTAVFKGRVIDGATGLAVARARVRLMGPGGQRDPAVADESGAFAFVGLPPGSYSVAAERTGYVTGRYPETGQTLRTSFTPVNLADGQVLEGVTIVLFRGGVIAGRVIDANGEPVEYASVQALRVPRSGRGRPQMRNGASTNDLGEFRLAHLDPGRYLLLVMPRVDLFVQPDTQDLRPVATYYPGVPTIDQAQPVTLERGGSATGLDMTVIGGFQALVSGRIVDPSGEPLSRAMVSVRPVMRDVPNYSGSNGTGVKPDGTFQFRLAPGEYELEGRTVQAGMGGPLPPDAERYGRIHVSVSGDVSDIVIALGSGAKISGRLVFDGASPVPPLTNAGQGVNFTPQSGSDTCRAGRSELSPDGSFTVDGVFGTCVGRVSGGFGPWVPKSITYNGKELMDLPIAFEQGQQLRDVQVILTDRRTEITLRVDDERSSATREFVALVFAVDKTRWTDNSRYVRWFVPFSPQMQPTMTGSTSVGTVVSVGSSGGTVGVTPGGVAVTRSTVVSSGPPGGAIPGSGGAPAPAPRPDMISGLPAGEYYAVAIDDLEPESIHDPDILERLSRNATRLILNDDTKTELSLRRVKLADVLGDGR